MADDDDPYDCVGGGGLRLKGNKSKKSKKKKKKSKKNTAEKILDHAAKSNKLQDNNSDEEKPSSSSSTDVPVMKTAAELAFEKAQEKRAAQRILEKASKTHKQRVEELNDYLGGLSEHYDVQKVSWTK